MTAFNPLSINLNSKPVTGNKEYIITLFTEKDKVNEVCKYAESKSLFGFDLNALADFCENSVHPDTQKKIRNNFVKIDFHNGDIMHFAKFIIDGIVKEYGF